MNITIQLDTVVDVNGDGDEHTIGMAAWRDVVASYGVTMNVVDEHGPGGGWPVIDYTGSVDNVGALLYEHFDMTIDEASEL